MSPEPTPSQGKVYSGSPEAIADIPDGALILLGDRLRDPEKRARSTYFDWFFIVVLTSIVFTGFASQITREMETVIMYPVYFVHLVLIFMLFVYAPYSKLAHLVYRTVAMAAMRRDAK